MIDHGAKIHENHSHASDANHVTRDRLTDAVKPLKVEVGVVLHAHDTRSMAKLVSEGRVGARVALESIWVVVTPGAQHIQLLAAFASRHPSRIRLLQNRCNQLNGV